MKPDKLNSDSQEIDYEELLKTSTLPADINRLNDRFWNPGLGDGTIRPARRL